MISTLMRTGLLIVVLTGAVSCAAALPLLPADDAPASPLAADARSAAAEARKPSAGATCTEVPSRGDVSWIQTYNAAWVRIKANGALTAAVDAAAPGLLQFVSFIADCPAVPEAYPFPCRRGAKRLNRVLKRRKVVVALQDLGPELAAFTAAFKAINRALASEIAAAYGIDLGVEFAVYPDSNSAVTAVIDGAADCTDPFYRQWTLVGIYPRQVRRLASGGGLHARRRRPPRSARRAATRGDAGGARWGDGTRLRPALLASGSSWPSPATGHRRRPSADPHLLSPPAPQTPRSSAGWRPRPRARCGPPA